MEEKDFNDKYWFRNTQLVKVVNPRSEDFNFQTVIETGIDVATGRPRVETRQYTVRAGGTEKFPGVVANIYLDQVTKLLAQEDDEIQRIIDFSLKAEYYEKLIVGVDDILNNYQPYAAQPEVASGTPVPVADSEKPFPTIAESEAQAKEPAAPPKTAAKATQSEA